MFLEVFDRRLFFRDCCWDYEDVCKQNSQPQPRSSEFVKADQAGEATSEEPAPHTEAFQCAVVHQYSEESFWMVTKCATDWKDTEISQRCSRVSWKHRSLQRLGFQ